MSAGPPEERVRLFVALELPEAVLDTLSGWRDRVLRRERGLRPVARESLHVTLCFLGWTDVSQIDPIAGACKCVAVCPAASLMLGEAIWLPPRRARVLAVELGDRDDALAGAQSALSDSLAAGGWYVPEKRPFLAHVTVARVRTGARVRERPLRPPVPEAKREPFAGSTVTLFRSRLSRSGARYEPLASVHLGGGGSISR